MIIWNIPYPGTIYYLYKLYNIDFSVEVEMVPLNLMMIFLIDITTYHLMEIKSIVTRGTFMVIRQIRKVS